MDDILNNPTMYNDALKKYMTTLEKTGEVSKCNQKILLMSLLLQCFMKIFKDYMTPKETQKMKTLVKCFLNKSCFTNHIEDVKKTEEGNKTYVFFSEEDTLENYLDKSIGHEQKTAKYGTIKGTSVNIFISGKDQHLIVISKDPSVTASSEWWDVPFNSTKIQKGYYLHESVNTYKNQRLNIKFK